MNASDSLCVCTQREWTRLGSIGRVAHFLYFLPSGPFCRIFLRKTPYFACRGRITTCFSVHLRANTNTYNAQCLEGGPKMMQAVAQRSQCLPSLPMNLLLLTSSWPMCGTFRIQTNSPWLVKQQTETQMGLNSSCLPSKGNDKWIQVMALLISLNFATCGVLPVAEQKTLVKTGHSTSSQGTEWGTHQH